MKQDSQSSRPPVQSLRVWECALGLATEVYRVTQRFPADERFGLTAQMRRAAVSVAANLAEGQGRSGFRAFSAFVDVAVGSLREIEALSCVARKLGYLEEEDFQKLNAEIAKTAPLLVRLLTSLRVRAHGKIRNPT